MTDQGMPEDAPQPEGAPLIDARGLLCPLPLLRARRALLARAPGQTIRLLATEPNTRRDLPEFCRLNGFTLLADEETAQGMVFLLRRD